LARASSVRPIRARLSTSQKLQGRKAPSWPGKSVDERLVVGAVAVDERAVGELALDCLDGAADARVLGWQEPGGPDQQEAGVEFARAVGLGEGVPFGVVALAADLGVDPVADLPPARERSRQPCLLDGFDGAVEGDPGHYL
jgi:hypothetical protein